MKDFTHMIHGLDKIIINMCHLTLELNKIMINMCHITLELNIMNDGLYSHDTWT